MLRLTRRLSLALFLFAVSQVQAAVVPNINLNLNSAESSFNAALGVTANIIGLGPQSFFTPSLSLTPTLGAANVDIDWSNTGAFQSIDFNSQSAFVPNYTFNYTIPPLPVIGSIGSVSGSLSAVSLNDFVTSTSPASVIAPIGASGGSWQAALGTYSETVTPIVITGTGLLSFININTNLGSFGLANPANPFTAGTVEVGPDLGGFSSVKVTIPYAYDQYIAGPYTVIAGVLDNVGVLVRVSGQLVYSGEVATSAIPEAGSLALMGIAISIVAIPVIYRRRKIAA